MAKKSKSTDLDTINKQVADAEKKLRDLKRKQLEAEKARKVERYDMIVKLQPSIEEFDDDALVAFFRKLFMLKSLSDESDDGNLHHHESGYEDVKGEGIAPGGIFPQ